MTSKIKHVQELHNSLRFTAQLKNTILLQLSFPGLLRIRRLFHFHETDLTVTQSDHAVEPLAIRMLEYENRSVFGARVSSFDLDCFYDLSVHLIRVFERLARIVTLTQDCSQEQFGIVSNISHIIVRE